MRKAEIKIHDATAGWLTKDENGFHFVYDSAYLQLAKPEAVSVTLPVRAD
jgi:serine/threonine-protein kinase HipA